MYEYRPRVDIILFLLILGLSSPAGAASLEIAAARAMPLCEKIAAFFGPRLAPDAGLLNTVQWTAVRLKGQGPSTSHCSRLEKALLDLNNDGTQDLVVKTTFCMKGAPSDSLYLFPGDSAVLDEANWQDLSPLLATPDKFERTGGTYAPTALPLKEGTAPALSSLFTIYPFVLDGMSYVGLTDARRAWMVVAKYLGGERFEDQCYLRANPS
jgi:hypothetical protein